MMITKSSVKKQNKTKNRQLRPPNTIYHHQHSMEISELRLRNMLHKLDPWGQLTASTVILPSKPSKKADENKCPTRTEDRVKKMNILTWSDVLKTAVDLVTWLYQIKVQGSDKVILPEQQRGRNKCLPFPMFVLFVCVIFFKVSQ